MKPGNAFDRHTLPHFREPGAAYFVTWRLAEGQPALAAAERSAVAAGLLKFQGDRCHLMAWVVMDDHVDVGVVAAPPRTLGTDWQRPARTVAALTGSGRRGDRGGCGQR